jgi:nucleoside-diphosphate-sugar epimerase
MAVDFFEKEVEKLTIRFNRVYGTRAVFDLRSRYATIMAICRAMTIAKSVRDAPDEKRIGEMTREFCRIRGVLNGFFNLMESQQERRGDEHTDKQQIVADGG